MENQNQNSGAQDFFLYLVTYFSLSFLAFGSGSILFQAVNKFLPDQVSGTFDQDGARFGIAAIFIAGPIFFFVSKIIAKRLKNGIITINSGVRRWLTYIVLFFASGTVIGDLITLVFNFLNGETTVQFLLKILAIFIIAGGIFTYYFWDMRKTSFDDKSEEINKIAFIVSTVFVVIVFVGAFFVIDSPSLTRLKRIDRQTVSDVQSIDSSIRNFFNQGKKLPETLKDLEKTGFSPYLQSNNKVEYFVVGENTYKLCAVFLRSDIDDKDASFDMINSIEWKHAEGKVCFDRIALGDSNIPLPVK